MSEQLIAADRGHAATGIRVGQRLSPAGGIEIFGADLSAPLTPSLKALILKAFLDQLVYCPLFAVPLTVLEPALALNSHSLFAGVSTLGTTIPLTESGGSAASWTSTACVNG